MTSYHDLSTPHAPVESLNQARAELRFGARECQPAQCARRGATRGGGVTGDRGFDFTAATLHGGYGALHDVIRQTRLRAVDRRRPHDGGVSAPRRRRPTSSRPSPPPSFAAESFWKPSARLEATGTREARATADNLHTRRYQTIVLIFHYLLPQEAITTNSLAKSTVR